jgi:carbohydrate kinase (thermoresistant glucokinase family)
MGVSGVGKSTIAAALNAHLHWAYQEGDELHPAANIQKMNGNVALTDADRAPWLAAVKGWIDARLAAGEPGIITCSALKRSYRDMLLAGRPAVRILYLRADLATLHHHLAKRAGHFMPATMLDSQLETLEEPAPEENPMIVQVSGSEENTVRKILDLL